jgi:hypothetical protein
LVSGLFLLAALMGIAYLMVWMVQNDDVSRIEEQKGLFRMTVPKDSAAISMERPEAPRRRGPFVRPAGPKLPDRSPVRSSSLKVEKEEETVAPEAEEEIVHPLWQRPRRPRQRP